MKFVDLFVFFVCIYLFYFKIFTVVKEMIQIINPLFAGGVELSASLINNKHTHHR